MNDNNKTKQSNQNLKPNQNKDLSGSQTGTQVSNPGMNRGDRTPQSSPSSPQSSPSKSPGASGNSGKGYPDKLDKDVDVDASDRVSQRSTGGGSEIDDESEDTDAFTPGTQPKQGNQGKQSETSEKDESARH